MEKRNCKRKIKRLYVSFSDGNAEYNGISSDFSCNGLFIRTRKGFEKGTELEMVLDLDNGPTPLIGEVARIIKPRIATVKCGIGVKLTSISPEYENFIKELYEK